MKRRKPRRVHVEPLEPRHLLAAFGTPWPEPRALTVSFPTDRADIGAYGNSLRETMDQVTDRRVWQEAVLTAFQTWAVETNLNIGIKPDRGDHFGAVGLTQGDPRFGEFRIGAFPQEGVFANALPFATNAGSWAGDVFLNTQVNYFLADWESGSPVEVPDPSEKGAAIELFSVLLHEAGNALGLPDVQSPGSVMHEFYEGPKGALSGPDIGAIRALYGGARSDPYEVKRNDDRRRATRMPNPPADPTADPLARRGSLRSTRDVDHYWFSPPADQEKVTVRLRAAGISLLKAHLFVLDHTGKVIADVKADSIFENDLELEIGSLGDHRKLFVRVEGNGDDLFSIGDYQVELDYRPQELQPDLIPLVYDLDAEDDGESPPPFDAEATVDAIFSRHGLVDTELGSNDQPSTATRLDSSPGFLPGTRYEAQGALTDGDVDYFVFSSPAEVAGALVVKIDPLGLETPTLHADVLDSFGNRVAARVTPRPDGSVTFEIPDPRASFDYYVRVRADGAKDVRSGNYMLTIDAATRTEAARPLWEGVLGPDEVRWAPIAVRKTQLFRFDAEVFGERRFQGMTITVYDQRNANVVYSGSVGAESPGNGYVWLQQGEYYLRLAALTRLAPPTAPVAYRLRVAGISDDQGPLPIDPTDPYGGADPYAGISKDPDAELFLLPDPYDGADPYLSEPLNNEAVGEDPPYEVPPFEDPWYYDPYFDPYSDSYYA